MTHARRLLAVTAIAFGLQSGLAQAQPRERDDNRGPRQELRQDQRRLPPPHRAEPPRRHDPRPMAQPPGHRFDRGPGAGPDHRWHRGDRLPSHYRTPHYVVDNWRLHRLSAPPRGYRWVQVGADYVLVAIASGVIFQIVIGH